MSYLVVAVNEYLHSKRIYSDDGGKASDAFEQQFGNFLRQIAKPVRTNSVLKKFAAACLVQCNSEGSFFGKMSSESRRGH